MAHSYRRGRVGNELRRRFRGTAIAACGAVILGIAPSLVRAQIGEPPVAYANPPPTESTEPVTDAASSAESASPADSTAPAPAPTDESVPEVVDPAAMPPPTSDDFDVDSLGSMSLESLLEIPLTTRAATLFDETWLETPATVDVVPEAAWRRIGARRMMDAIGFLPSTVVYPQAYGGEGISMRGYAVTNSPARGVAVLLDGVPLNDLRNGSAIYTLSNLQLPSLGRIDLVRGPGSAIYGSDAFHGVLALHSYESSTNAIEGGVEAGTDGYHRGYARVSQSVGESLRFHATGSYSGLPDQNLPFRYTDPTTGAEVTSTRDWSDRNYHASMQLRYAPATSRFDATASFHVARMVSTGWPGIGRPSGTASRLADNDVSGHDGQLYLGRAIVGVDLPHDIRVEATGYGYYSPNEVGLYTVASSPSGPIVPRVRYVSRDGRAGARLTVQQDGLRSAIHTQWLFGTEFSRLKLGDGNDAYVLLPGATMESRSDQVTAGLSRNIVSAFLSAQTRLFRDYLHLHYGGRIDWFSDVGTQATPRAGLVVTPNSNLAFKLLYGRAFRPPTGGERRGTPPTVLGSTSISPEIIDTLELVAQVQREHWRFGSTLYGSKWRDGIAVVPRSMPLPGEPPTVYANAAHNSAFGAELMFDYANHGLRLDASGSYVRSKNDDNEHQYRAFPQFIANLGAGYRFEEQRLEFYVSQRVMARWTEYAPTATLVDPPSLRPYYQMNVHIEWEAIPERFDFFVDVRNALNLRNQISSPWGAENGTNGTPYNASIGLRIRNQ